MTALALNVLAAALLYLLVSLALWQYDRGQEKQADLDAYAARAVEASDGWRLAERVADGERFLEARLDGRYLGGLHLLLDNRTHAGRAGYHVFTFVADEGRALLVNRGWVPVGASRTSLPEVAIETPVTQVEGLLDRIPRSGLLLGEDGFSNLDSQGTVVVQRISLEALSEQFPDLAIHDAVLLLDPVAANGFVRDWAPHEYMTPERHFGYALQWASLAVTLLVIVVVMNRRALRARRRDIHA